MTRFTPVRPEVNSPGRVSVPERPQSRAATPALFELLPTVNRQITGSGAVSGRQTAGVAADAQRGRLGISGVTLPTVLGHGKTTQRPRSKQPQQTPEERRQKARDARAERWVLRSFLRDFTTLRSLRRCGSAPIPRVDHNGETRREVTLRVSAPSDEGRHAGYGGVQHCGSVWACTVCSAVVATRRANEIATVLRWALDQGYQASMMTLTLQHFEGQRLKQVWNAVSAGWKAATGGRGWVAEQAAYGVEGWVRAVEVTHGANGWHVHIHTLLIWDPAGAETTLTEGALESDHIQELANQMHERWTRGVRKKGFDSIAALHGLDVRRASLDPEANGLHEYFTKMAFEITGGYAKKAKGKGRAPFQILNDALKTGLVDDFELWEEWEQGSKGRRQIGWSEGLRERAGLAETVTDEELANEEMAADEVITLAPKTHVYLVRDTLASLELLAVTEDGGLDAGCQWLDDRGLRWRDRRVLRPG